MASLGFCKVPKHAHCQLLQCCFIQQTFHGALSMGGWFCSPIAKTLSVQPPTCQLGVGRLWVLVDGEGACRLEYFVSLLSHPVCSAVQSCCFTSPLSGIFSRLCNCFSFYRNPAELATSSPQKTLVLINHTALSLLLGMALISISKLVQWAVWNLSAELLLALPLLCSSCLLLRCCSLGLVSGDGTILRELRILFLWGRMAGCEPSRVSGGMDLWSECLVIIPQCCSNFWDIIIGYTPRISNRRSYGHYLCSVPLHLCSRPSPHPHPFIPVSKCRTSWIPSAWMSCSHLFPCCSPESFLGLGNCHCRCGVKRIQYSTGERCRIDSPSDHSGCSVHNKL